ncbi:MAG: efflux RND transporter periplasmic adaptor subunit [Gammaproteobacteria bacterium]|nr:efflux RND transporter periplasmic adaptor subunit [Gammaproteobacteria bacterium]
MKTKKSFSIFFALTFFLWSFSAKNAFAEAKNNPATLVEAITVKSEPFKKRITLTGTIRAHQGITIRPEVAGKITQIFFTSGSFVKSGTPLIQINKQIVEAKLRQSQSEMMLAKQNFARMEKLYKFHVISKAAYDEVFAKYNTAVSQVNEAQATLNQTFIVAPFSGKIGLSAVDTGDYVDVGQKIVSLEMIDPIEVEFNLPETFLGNLAVGQSINLNSSSFPNTTFVGKVYAIDSVIDVNTRSVAVRAILANSENKLLPGGFVEVNIDMVSKNPVLIIPQTAIFYDVNQNFVYKIVQNKAAKTKITLGERDRENVVVLGGLNAGDLIVTAGQLKINDGDTVKVTKGNK